MSPRILIVNPNWIGDVLFSTPAIRAIRKKFPTAYLACWVPRRCREIFAHNPYLNEVLVEPNFLKLKSSRFDTAIFFHRSRSKSFRAMAAGIPERIGYETPDRKRFLTKVIPLRGDTGDTLDIQSVPSVHKTDLFLNLLNKIGVPSDGRSPDFFVGPEVEKNFELHRREWGSANGEPYVVLHAGGNWELKRWPAANFIEWIKLFRKEYPWRIFLCGTAAEKSVADMIAGEFSGGNVISLCGKTSLGELAILLKGAEFLLSNDSGPIHLAASQKTKIIGLFGPTSPALTGPISDAPMAIMHKDVGCEIPCYFRSCHYRVCMEWLTPEEVLEKAKELLA